jgi:hypothetical protein
MLKHVASNKADIDVTAALMPLIGCRRTLLLRIRIPVAIYKDGIDIIAALDASHWLKGDYATAHAYTCSHQ